MNKSELIAAVAQRADITKKDAERAVNVTFEIIAAQLAAGEKVQLAGFGSFEVKNREARVGRNPHTKEPVEIPPSKAPVFKPSKNLKEAIEK